MLSLPIERGKGKKNRSLFSLKLHTLILPLRMNQKRFFFFTVIFSLFCLVYAQSKNDTNSNAPKNTPNPSNNTASNSTASNNTASNNPPAKNEPNITSDRVGRLWITQPQLSSSIKVRLRLGDKFLIKWKLDENVQVEPDNFTLAISTNQRDWVTVGVAKAGARTFTWDTSKWDAVERGPLALSTPYTMAIYDGAQGLQGELLNGYMMANLDIKFSLYQSDENICAACNSALGKKPAWWCFIVVAILAVAVAG